MAFPNVGQPQAANLPALPMKKKPLPKKQSARQALLAGLKGAC